MIKVIYEDYHSDEEYKEIYLKIKDFEKIKNDISNQIKDHKVSDEDMRKACGYSEEEWKYFNKSEKEANYSLFGNDTELKELESKYLKIIDEIDKLRRIINKMHKDDFNEEGGNIYKNNPPKKATKSSYKGFQIDTGEYHQDYYENPNYAKTKGYKEIYLAEMSPDEYIDRCSKEIFGVTVKNTKKGMEQPEKVSEYAEMMKNGTKFYMPYLDLKILGQEGRHRALAAKELGINIIPVLYLR